MGTLTGHQPARPVNPHDANGISRIYPKADRTAAKTAYVTWLANKKNNLYGGGANPGLFDHTGLTYSDESGGFSGIGYRVTVASTSGGNKYFINGLETPTLTIIRDNATNYRFNTSDGSVGSHPFKLSTTPDGTHGGGSEYTFQVTSGSGYHNLFAKTNVASILYYYCASHSGMGGKIILS